MRVGLGSDHLGFALKECLRPFLIARGDEVRDFGGFSEEPIDYPDVAVAVAMAVVAGEVDRAVLVCGTGLGMAIAANKVPRVFAAPVSDRYTAQLAWERNHAQVLTLGANVVEAGLACALVDVWLSAEFRGGDSARRAARVRVLEESFRHTAPPVLSGR